MSSIPLTPRLEQVHALLVQGYTNPDIAKELGISHHTVKNYVRSIAISKGITRKTKLRIDLAKLHIANNPEQSENHLHVLTMKEYTIAQLVWQNKTSKEIAGLIHTSEQVVKNHLSVIYDKLGVWSRLELALYMAKGKCGLDATPEPTAVALESSESDFTGFNEVLQSKTPETA